ncbi:SCP2 domain-containing protein [Azonexus sp.]|uniref:ubiquinone biosynthesis accessory factor UbiJ n=1 Tax=Azonexus sp. TaxID=1872668 RepID=UPI0027B97917|nr:hypothetical protein [Azonexus sp.]
MSILERLIVLPINHLVADAPWAGERLRQHAGGVLRIKGGVFSLLLQIDGTGFLRACDASLTPDVCIDLPPDFLLRAAVDRNNLMSAARLSGMADFAETLAFVFRNLRWDIEGDLARFLGDIPARRLAMSGGALVATLQETGRRLGDNLTEYATADAGMLASPTLIKTFNGEVDVLRDDVARLEKRLARLTGIA